MKVQQIWRKKTLLNYSSKYLLFFFSKVLKNGLNLYLKFKNMTHLKKTDFLMIVCKPFRGNRL